MKRGLTKWVSWKSDAGGALFCVGLSLLAYLVVLRPMVRRHVAFGRQRDRLSVERKKASQLAATADSLRKQLTLARQELADSRITLQSSGYVNRRIADLTALMKKCNMEADDIQLGTIFRGSRCQVVPIVLAGSSSYGDCVLFLRGLSRTFPDTGVASMELTGAPQEPGQAGRFRFELFWHAAPGPSPLK